MKGRYAASTSALNFAPSRFSAIARSYRVGRFIQNAAPAEQARPLKSLRLPYILPTYPNFIRAAP